MAVSGLRFFLLEMVPCQLSVDLDEKGQPKWSPTTTTTKKK